MNNPSQSDANKVLRVLKGERLKYTIRVNQPDGSVIEFQAGSTPSLQFFEADRCLWLMSTASYNSVPVMRWIDGSILQVEENPAP